METRKLKFFHSIMLIVAIFFSSCTNETNDTVQSSVDNGDGTEVITEESEDVIKIISYSSDVTCSLYNTEDCTLFVKFKVFKAGDYTLEWMRNCSEKTELFGSKIVTLTAGEEYSTILNIKKCDYLSAVYNVRILDNFSGEEIKSPDIKLIQTVDTGIPSLYITTENFVDITSKEKWLNASIEIKSETYGDSTIVTKIKGRGNTSWSTEKKPYSLKLDNKQSLLGMESSKRWVLINNHVDKSLLRNKLASEIGNTVFDSYWNPSFKFVDLILNGEYKGSYLLGESVKIDKKRVNIQSLEDTVKGKGNDLNGDGFIDIHDGGFICEINNKREFFYFATNKIPIITLKEPEPDDFETWNDEIELYIKGIVQDAEDCLYSDDWLNQESGYKTIFDINSIIDWYLISDFLKSADAKFNTSVFFYYDPIDKKIHFGPNWDFDDCCGNYIGYTEDLYKTEEFWIKGNKQTSWINRMFEDPVFIQEVKDRWNEKKTLLNKIIFDGIQENADELALSAENNFKRYPILGSYVFETYAALGYEERLTYQSEVDYLINWCKQRYIWFDNAINML